MYHTAMKIHQDMERRECKGCRQRVGSERQKGTDKAETACALAGFAGLALSTF
jgi:hypothetical protein